eukprot:RCo016291
MIKYNQELKFVSTSTLVFDERGKDTEITHAVSEGPVKPLVSDGVKSLYDQLLEQKVAKETAQAEATKPARPPPVIDADEAAFMEDLVRHKQDSEREAKKAEAEALQTFDELRKQRKETESQKEKEEQAARERAAIERALRGELPVESSSSSSSAQKADTGSGLFGAQLRVVAKKRSRVERTSPQCNSSEERESGSKPPLNKKAVSQSSDSPNSAAGKPKKLVASLVSY